MSGIDRIEKIPLEPTHALKVIDNWDGEGDQAFVFAFENEGVFYRHDNGKPVIEYIGDKVLKVWPLA